jgi:hypothetical protein
MPDPMDIAVDVLSPTKSPSLPIPNFVAKTWRSRTTGDGLGSCKTFSPRSRPASARDSLISAERNNVSERQGKKGSDSQRDTLLSEVYDKAFITFKTFLSASVAVQSMHGTNTSMMKVSAAPEPRGVMWNNIHLSSHERGTRSLVANVFVYVERANASAKGGSCSRTHPLSPPPPP